MLAAEPRQTTHRRRWLIAAVALVGIGAAALVAVVSNRPNERLPIFLVLTHPTIRVGAADTAVALNRTTFSLNTTGAAILPRRGTRFPRKGPFAFMWDDPYNSVAPQSRRRILQPSWSTYPPGKYWVWMAYAGFGSSDEWRFAYSKLTIVRR